MKETASGTDGVQRKSSLKYRNAWKTCRAVSYTHLDVYKRQQEEISHSIKEVRPLEDDEVDRAEVEVP